MFLHLANGKKNIGKQFEGNGGLTGVICFKGYVKGMVAGCHQEGTGGKQGYSWVAARAWW